jgi:hypothetical protein
VQRQEREGRHRMAMPSIQCGTQVATPPNDSRSHGQLVRLARLSAGTASRQSTTTPSQAGRTRRAIVRASPSPAHAAQAARAMPDNQRPLSCSTRCSSQCWRSAKPSALPTSRRA